MASTRLLLTFVLLGVAQTTRAQGIQFLEADFDHLISQARVENKLAFVEIYLTGCPHCEALAPVLKEKEVGDFYNPQFVSLKLEANSAFSKALREKKKLHYPEFPLLLYFDASGNLIHQATPVDQPTRDEFVKEIIRHGTEALSPATRTSSYAARYEEGERSLDFLINYAKYAKTTRDTVQLTTLAAELGRTLAAPADREGPYGFYLISRIVNDFQNPIAGYFFQHLEAYRTKYSVQATQQAGETILFQTLYGKRAGTLSAGEVVAMRQAMESLGIAPHVAASRTILKELEAYFRQKATAAAVTRFATYRTNLSPADLAYFVRFFNEKAPDPSYAAALVEWINDTLAATPPADQNKAEFAELYREQSEAYRRLGKMEPGKRAAAKAVSIATAAQEDLATYGQQLAKFTK